MIGHGGRCSLWRAARGGLGALLALVAVGCGGGPDAVATPGAGPAATAPAAVPVPDVTQSPQPSVPATAVAAGVPAATRTPALATPATPQAPTSTPVPATQTPVPTPIPPLTLRLLAPLDGAGVEIGAVGVLGKTRPDAVVAVNGVPVEVDATGTFRHDLILEDGANLIEVVAADLLGSIESAQAAVFIVSTAAGLPFSLLYPPDGLEVFEPQVEVMGVTRPDAVIGVNGIALQTNSLGVFFTTATLEEGPNLIEIVATDINSNVRFQTIVIFYSP